MNRRSTARLLVVIVLLSCTALASRAGEDPHFSPNAPKDKPQKVMPEQYREFVQAREPPYVKKARDTYPAAKARFLAGLPEKHSFFVTTRLLDDQGHMEQVFVAVDTITKGVITGRIWSDVSAVAGYKHGDPLQLPETELIDWLITMPDGTEEGNYVGKFLDHYRPSGAK